MMLRGKHVVSRVRFAIVITATLLFLIMIGTSPYCQAYFVGKIIHIQPRGPVTHYTPSSSQDTPRLASIHTSMSSSSPHSIEGQLQTEIASLCEAGQFKNAIETLEHSSPDDDTKSCYVMILNSLVEHHKQLEGQQIERKQKKIAIYKPTSNEDALHLHQANNVLQRLLELGEIDSSLLPSAEDINSVIRIWGSSAFVENASVQCHNHLKTLWSLYNKHRDKKFVPLNTSYYYVIRACSMRDRGSDAAKLAENLMEEMESVCQDHPELTPDRSIANEVLNALSKSGQKFTAGRRCETLLEKMIEMALSNENGERHKMTPDTTSFNIVLNALAQGKEKNADVRAESLLERMESLSSSSEESGNVVINCPPDETSFNTVLNGWARSRQRGAAERATSILDHMRKRNEAGLSKVHPDWSTYSTVLKAWAGSRDRKAMHRAETIFEEYQKGCEVGKWGLSHNSLTYNSMINCYAKSKHPEAGQRATELFNKMKANSVKKGWELCFVDIYTFTSLIDAISKQESYDSSELAISLLEEVEDSFKKTGDKRLQPNVRLYTSVVNAIGRSHKDPNRAQDIVNRLESSYLEEPTQWENKPDVVFYNALINAYGWSDIEGRSRKCFEILKHMVSLHQSGKLSDAKPDTVSFNSVLNACAYEKTNNSQSKSDDIMKTAVETFELLNNSSKYGKPDPSTYVQVLIAITNHMAKDDEKRDAMAEAIFLKCAGNGLICPVIIPKLHAAISLPRFRILMGSAFTGEKPLRYDVSKLPLQWTANAPRRQTSTPSSRSRHRPNNFQVTKNIISNSMKKGRKKEIIS